MQDEIATIILSSELQNEVPNGMVEDVIVRMTNGEDYAASFFSYKSIEWLKEQHRKEDVYLKGTYFWARRMVLIEKCVATQIRKVVADLLEEGDFKNVFRKI